jgi:hypothetical protein
MATKKTGTDTDNVGMYGTAVSASISLYSGIIEADLIKKQAETQRSIDLFNADQIDKDAWKMQGYGQEVIARQQTQTDQLKGTQKVMAAAQGRDITEGSSLEAVTESELNSYLNQVDMENSIADRVAALRVQSSNARMGSDMNTTMANLRANATQRNAFLTAATIVGAGAAKYTGINQSEIMDKIKSGAAEQSPDGEPFFQRSSASGYGAKPVVAQQTTNVNGIKFTENAVIIENLPTEADFPDVKNRYGSGRNIIYTMP